MMMMDFSGFFTKDGTKCLFFFLEGEGGGLFGSALEAF